MAAFLFMGLLDKMQLYLGLLLWVALKVAASLAATHFYAAGLLGIFLEVQNKTENKVCMRK